MNQLEQKMRAGWLGGLCLALLGCGGGSSDPVPPPPPTPGNAVRTLAASTTASSTTNACAPIKPFYWEIGDKTSLLASASVNAAGSAASYDANTPMNIASASKWRYGAYVAERRGGALTAEDIQFLNFRSGYTNFSSCDPADTVASCVARGTNGVQSINTINKFFYSGGHMEKHASLATPGMALGPLDNAALATEMRRLLGIDIRLSYTQPQLAGGARTTPADYAVFLRKLLNNQLKMGALLGSNPVCTNPATCASAAFTPITDGKSWHYSIGHWVEDDPSTGGDGAFSSAGAFGFYPWVDVAKVYYGIVARVDLAGSGNESATCGALIRKAWQTGVAQ